MTYRTVVAFENITTCCNGYEGNPPLCNGIVHHHANNIPIVYFAFLYHQDVNECLHDNGRCFQHCHNTDGSHYCACKEGYILSTDQRSCVGMVLVQLNISSAIFKCSIMIIRRNSEKFKKEIE